MVGRTPRLLVVVDGFAVRYDAPLPPIIYEMKAVSPHEPGDDGVAVLVGFAKQVAGCCGSGESQQRYFTSRSVRVHSLFKRGQRVTGFTARDSRPSAHNSDKGFYGFVLKGRELGATMTVELAGFVVEDVRGPKLRIDEQLHEVANEGLGVRDVIANVVSHDGLLWVRG